MSDFQEQFKIFILNDIFWFDKSEVNFGIYKIFRQKEKLIKDKLDLIVDNIKGSLTQDRQDGFEILKNELINYIPPKKAKNTPLDSLDNIKTAIENFGNGDTEQLLKQLNALQVEDKYDATKIYEYLYQFFHLYYEKGDFGYTPRSFRTYTLPYHHEEHLIKDTDKCVSQTSNDAMYAGEETLFTWKTKDSYYIKSSKLLNNVVLNLDYEGKAYAIHTQVIEKDDDIKDDKKIKQYRLVSIKKEAGNKIYLQFNISDKPTPKHTTYVMMLAVIKSKVNKIDYNAISQDKAVKDYLEILPFTNTPVNTSLLDKSVNKITKAFAEIMLGDIAVYLHKGNGGHFKYKLTGEEDKAQIKAKISKLMLSKKEYASKVYTKKAAKEALGISTFDFDDKKQLEVLYEHDVMLNFFYRLDRGVNLFYAGVDSDYFIHKNLKCFLSVELDKFIKNYIFVDTDALLRMDESARQVALFARVFKEQAHVFIDILASIEEFQKYLWNKRKMVKSSHYVISSNKIEDESLLQMALNNQVQVDEWVELGLSDTKPDLDEIKHNSFPVDTKHFDILFKFQLLSQFEHIEEALSGLLIKSENYQALRFLEPKYKENIKCIYIDPPYNTGNDGFVYKDSYKEASWLSMMQDRLEMAKESMEDDGVIFISIDDKEAMRLKGICDEVFGEENFISNMIWAAGRKNDSKLISVSHEYMLVYATNRKYLSDSKIEWRQKKKGLDEIYKQEKKLRRKFGDDFHSMTQGIKDWYKNLADGHPSKDHKHYNTIDKKGIYFPADISWPGGGGPRYKVLHPITKQPVKIPSRGWMTSDSNKLNQWINDDEVHFGVDETCVPCIKSYLKDKEYQAPYSVFYQDGRAATKRLRHVLGADDFGYPKDEIVLSEIIDIVTDQKDFVLDFFSGSGTTAHATINLNRKDNGKRKFIVVEMNDYFETIILPRIKKVNFSNEWKNGRAKNKNGYGGFFQYIELEQYDDIIDGLQVIDDVNYSKIDTRYIYEPDKNKINFRMEQELAEPLSDKTHFDIFHSLLFHRGLILHTVSLEGDVLFAECSNKQDKACAIVLSDDEANAIARVESLDSSYAEIFANVRTHNVTRIVSDLFKG